jgi:signal transduction histidine kinase
VPGPEVSSARGLNFELHPGVETETLRLDPGADDGVARPAYRFPRMIAAYRWFTRAWFEPSSSGERTAPIEAIALRTLGLVYLTVFIIDTFKSTPHPGLQGRGLAILVATIAFVAAAIGAQPRRDDVPIARRVAFLVAVAIATAVLAALQPKGIWEAGPYFIGIMAALRLDRRSGVLMLAFTVILLLAVSAVERDGGGVPSVLLGAIPWFLLIRVMRVLRDQRDELAVSRAAAAQAAAAAERGRLAREMHDVLAHSLSALALQLETTRMLARDRGVDGEVAGALDSAHHLAATGLEEARRAIATERGDELPGPERIGLLADAFGEQSGLPIAVEVNGEPRELAPEARLAVYRTAQEALTNVRRHATPERVEVRLDYLPEGTVLVVEDHVPAGTPSPVALGTTANGYGLTGMRERAELLGGQLLAAPTGDGFRVELRLPT